jgi:hypothetical protein
MFLIQFCCFLIDLSQSDGNIAVEALKMAHVESSTTHQLSLSALESIAQAHLQAPVTLEGRTQMTDGDEDESEGDNLDSKVFTVNDIQTLLQNQLLTKSGLDEAPLGPDGKPVEQQHLILVTQNGDRIILIQNSAVNVSEEQSPNGANETNHPNELTITEVKANKHRNQTDSLEQLENHLSAAINHRSNDSELGSFLGVEPPELTADELAVNRVQSQHRQRQSLLLTHLNKLRDDHKDKIVNNEIVSAPKRVKRCQTPLDEDSFWIGDDCVEKSSASESNRHSTRSSSHNFSKSTIRISCDKSNNSIPWYPQLCTQLQKVFAYVRRRSESVDQLSKYFPSASHSFQGRCQELRKDMRKIELNIERFQNMLGKELNHMSDKLKTFFEDYHLESIASEIDEEEKIESERLRAISGQSSSGAHLPFGPAFVPCGPSHELSAKLLKAYVNEQRAASDSFISKIELITPSSISITATSSEPDDNDPVPEVRDIDCDAPLELLESFYTLGQASSSRSNASNRLKRSSSRKTYKDDDGDPSTPTKTKIRRN